MEKGDSYREKESTEPPAWMLSEDSLAPGELEEASDADSDVESVDGDETPYEGVGEGRAAPTGRRAMHILAISAPATTVEESIPLGRRGYQSRAQEYTPEPLLMAAHERRSGRQSGLQESRESRTETASRTSTKV